MLYIYYLYLIYEYVIFSVYIYCHNMIYYCICHLFTIMYMIRIRADITREAQRHNASFTRKGTTRHNM